MKNRYVSIVVANERGRKDKGQHTSRERLVSGSSGGVRKWKRERLCYVEAQIARFFLTKRGFYECENPQKYQLHYSEPNH